MLLQACFLSLLVCTTFADDENKGINYTNIDVESHRHTQNTRKYPFMVYFGNGHDSDGSGTILNKHFILTLASCVSKNIPSVYLGNKESIDIESITIHEKYKNDKDNYNIAILETFLEMPLDYVKEFVKLPSPNFSIKRDLYGMVLTWLLPPYGPTSMTTSVVELFVAIFNNSTCSQDYREYNMTKNMCVTLMWKEDFDEKCDSNNGAPVLSNGFQIGIIAEPSVKTKFCNLYRRSNTIVVLLSAHLDWINENKKMKKKKKKESNESWNNTNNEKKKSRIKIKKKSNASSFRPFFLIQTVAFCVALTRLFN